MHNIWEKIRLNPLLRCCYRNWHVTWFEVVSMERGEGRRRMVNILKIVKLLIRNPIKNEKVFVEKSIAVGFRCVFYFHFYFSFSFYSPIVTEIGFLLLNGWVNKSRFKLNIFTLELEANVILRNIYLFQMTLRTKKVCIVSENQYYGSWCCKKGEILLNVRYSETTLKPFYSNNTFGCNKFRLNWHYSI